MERKGIVAEIARELGVPEEVVERTVYALLERFGEGPPSLTAQLISELRGIAHQLGRLEGEFGEFRRMAEPRLEQVGELTQRVERLEGMLNEFMRATDERFRLLERRIEEIRREFEGRLDLLEKRIDRLEKWLFAFLVPILLAILSVAIRVFALPP